MKRLWRQAQEIDLGSTAFFRTLGLVAGLLANLSAIAALTRGFGAHEYAAYALIASLVNLLPFADLGLGASVVNSTSDARAKTITEEQYRRHLSRVRDLLVLVAAFIIVVDVVLVATGGLRTILGVIADVPGAVEASAFTLACIALSLPLGLGNRILQGRGRMIDVVRSGLVGPAFTIVVVGACVVFHAPAFVYFLAPGVAYLSIAVVSYIVAMRQTDVRMMRIGTGLRSPVANDVKTASTAIPFLIISIGLAAGFQSHRLILANIGTADDVAQYSVVAQFAGPALALITVIGQNLWTKYRTGVSTGTLKSGDFNAHVLLFSVIGLMAGVAIVLVVPFAAGILTNGGVMPSIWLCAAAAGYILVTAAHQPSAMFLNDPRGLQIQASLVILVAATSISFMLVTTPSIGAVAPYLGTSVAMLLLQVVPSILLVQARLRRNVAMT
ncbi:lipopolysaccharide biosynthesis protein [Plantibacter sp. YIM 135249]|uniref:lipopolysaccharide biosynthesis protein n=1 Tax=Plantibacter sp. YIM 135249 TaxID=3423918 RepID=UPI003D340374